MRTSQYGEKVLGTMMGEDCRDHVNWFPESSGLTYINLFVGADSYGTYLGWNGDEKSYDMTRKLNFISKHMARQSIVFKMEGEMLCQGKDMDDRYYIRIDDNGEAFELPVDKDKIICPNCNHAFAKDG
ncbi:MAG: hypothetical protein H8D23_27860 [Candidatus Brocadiales bacterium]|nr:hypothetical protein [Candidatus Brocadiales bacterium]